MQRAALLLPLGNDLRQERIGTGRIVWRVGQRQDGSSSPMGKPSMARKVGSCRCSPGAVKYARRASSLGNCMPRHVTGPATYAAPVRGCSWIGQGWSQSWLVLDGQPRAGAVVALASSAATKLRKRPPARRPCRAWSGLQRCEDGLAAELDAAQAAQARLADSTKRPGRAARRGRSAPGTAQGGGAPPQSWWRFQPARPPWRVRCAVRCATAPAAHQAGPEHVDPRPAAWAPHGRPKAAGGTGGRILDQPRVIARADGNGRDRLAPALSPPGPKRSMRASVLMLGGSLSAAAGVQRPRLVQHIGVVKSV